jgi:hypothetical protein
MVNALSTLQGNISRKGIGKALLQEIYQETGFDPSKL